MELKKIVLPSGIVAFLKSELTAGDADDLQDQTYGDLKIVMKKNEQTGLMETAPFEISPTIMTKRKYLLLSIVIDHLEDEGKTIIPTIDSLRTMSIADVKALEESSKQVEEGKLLTTEELGK